MRDKKSYYTEGYFKTRDFFPRYFAETFRLHLKRLPVKRILDVGCGTGRLVKFLKSSGYEAVGCDIADEAVKISGQFKGSATDLPFRNNSFEMVTAIHLIEHLTFGEMGKFLQEVRRVLKPNGYLYLDTPNLFSLEKIFRGKNWFGYSDPTHIQFYSPLSLKKILRQNNFYNERFRFKVDPKTPADWFFASPRLPQAFQYLINFLMLSTPLTYIRNSFWVLCQKRS